MKQAVACSAVAPALTSTITFSRVYAENRKLIKPLNVQQSLSFNRVHIKRFTVCCMRLTPWEPQPVTYAPTDEAENDFLKKTADVFDTPLLQEPSETTVSLTEEPAELSNQNLGQLHLYKWPLWVLGPSILLATGMVPTLWLPLSSIFLGPSIASLLSLIGLDCIFNFGATLFLLMADSCARPYGATQTCNSKAPFSYQFWNMVGSTVGFIIPLVMLFGSQNGFLQPQLHFIQFAVLLGPYLLLLSVQILTEMLIWHWQSPIWLVTPVVYEAYRVLQLMRGLKLGAELSVPGWMVHTVRGLVSWWVLILGMQLMRVAWFAGFANRRQQKQSSASAVG